jgi:hypothetical protein
VSTYGWIIDTDHLAADDTDTADEAGTIGPRDIPARIHDLLKAGKGIPFRLYDDDGILYYSGRYIGPLVDPVMSGPLDDFGRPNAGATEIRYREGDRWQPL